MHFNILEWWWKWLKTPAPTIKTYTSKGIKLYEYKGTGLYGKKLHPLSSSFNGISGGFTWSGQSDITRFCVQALDKWEDLEVAHTQTQYKRRHLLALAELL